MKKAKKILAFAREAGGAAAIAPVCSAMLEQGWKLLLLAKHCAREVFKKSGLYYTEFPVFNADSLNDLVNKIFYSLPDCVFTSATSIPSVDMTEKYLWRWGSTNKVLTIGVLDQWQNYAMRFSGPMENEKLQYIPDYIFAMDELAKKEMIAEGIPKKRILTVGQPAFDIKKDEQDVLSLRKNMIKDELGIKDGFIVVTFVAEALKKDFGSRLGYDEQSIILLLGDMLEKIVSRGDRRPKVYFLVKLHPENNKDEFNWLSSRWARLEKRIVKNELSSAEVISISDIVIGMTSVMLIESILAGRATVSLQIGSRVGSQLIATKTNSIPFIDTAQHAERVVTRLLSDKKYKEKYLDRQSSWMVGGNSVGNCMKALDGIFTGAFA